MKGKNLVVLCVAAAVLIVAAIVMSRSGGARAPDDIGKEVFPSLPVNDITRLVIRSQSETLEIVKQNETWVVPQKYGYPADFSKIRDALIMLSGLKVGQTLSLDDVQKRSLKIVPPDAGASPAQMAGSVLELYRNDAMVASLLIGDTHKRQAGGQASMYGAYPDGQYVSPDNGKTVYLIGQTLDSITSGANNWLDSDLVNVPSADVVSATIDAPDAKPLTLSRTEGGNLEIDGLSRKKTTDESKARSIAGALSYLRFKDIADPSLPDSVTGMDRPAVFAATTKNGEIYTVSIGGKQEGSDARYVRIRAAFDATAQPAAKPGTETPSDESKDDGDKEKDPKSKIEALDKRLSQWTYVVESYSTDAMTHKEDDLVKKKEEKKDDKKDDKAK